LKKELAEKEKFAKQEMAIMLEQKEKEDKVELEFELAQQ
jgi:hypothetical protein